jgi:hypothetical protein
MPVIEFNGDEFKLFERAFGAAASDVPQDFIDPKVLAQAMRAVRTAGQYPPSAGVYRLMIENEELACASMCFEVGADIAPDVDPVVFGNILMKFQNAIDDEAGIAADF